MDVTSKCFPFGNVTGPEEMFQGGGELMPATFEWKTEYLSCAILKDYSVWHNITW